MRTLALALLLLTGVEGGGGPKPDRASVAWDRQSTRLHLDAAAAVRFAVPTADYLVEAHHFDRQSAPSQLKDELLVAVGGEQALLVDVFHNPQGLSLARFFESYLAHLQDPATTVAEGRATPKSVPAILLDQPRTGQAFGQRIAVFALGERIVKVACIDRDQPSYVLLFERAVQSFEEVKP